MLLLYHILLSFCKTWLLYQVMKVRADDHSNENYKVDVHKYDNAKQRVEGAYILPRYEDSVSLIRIPDQNYKFYTELNHVCLEERAKGTTERQKFLAMHPLQYGTEEQNLLFNDHDSVPSNKNKNSPAQWLPTFANINASSAYQVPNRTIFFHGKTFFPQCYWHSNSPGHWIFAMSAIFELGRKSPNIFPQFDRIALVKCASWQQVLHEWEWGQVVLEAALDPLVEKGLFRTYDGNSNIKWANATDRLNPYPLPHIFSPVRHPVLASKPMLLCFESLHLIARWGVTSNSSTDVNAFRNSVLKTKLKRNKKSKPDIMTNPFNDATVDDRCQKNTLRVAVYLKPKGWPRNLINEDEILSLIHKYTTEVSVKRYWAPPMDEQLEMFNAFDILISPPGSQLVNIIFTNRTRVAVIEIGLAVRDAFWRENALRIGIPNYYYSMAGSDGDEKCYKENKMDKRCQVQDDGQTVLCPVEKGEQWNPIGDCSFILNTTVFEKQLQNVIRTLCKK